MHGFADADFDMDIDANFQESETFFFEKLGHIRKEDDAEEEEKEKSEDGDEAENQGAEEEKKDAEPKVLKPVTFLERPAAVRKAYNAQFDNYSDGSDDEDKLLDTLLEETKEPVEEKEPAGEALGSGGAEQ